VVKKAAYRSKIDQASSEAAVDKLIALLAGRQQGYVTRRQLLKLGVGRQAIAYRLRIGRLIRVYAGVYAVGHVNATPVGRAAAAVLACGDGAALSHGSAAWLWGFQRHWGHPIEVTAAAKHRRKGIRVHQSTTLTRRDTATHRGIHVTSAARTVYDVAPSLTDRALTRMINDALRSNLLRQAELAELIARHPGQRTSKRLAAHLEAIETVGITRSELEDTFNDLARRLGLPRPLINTHVAGREVDVLFADEGLIVEIDGYDVHGTRAAFEDDRERDAEMLLHGLSTVRVTSERLKADPEREAARLRAILDEHRRRRELLRSSQTRLKR